MTHTSLGLSSLISVIENLLSEIEELEFESERSESFESCVGNRDRFKALPLGVVPCS